MPGKWQLHGGQLCTLTVAGGLRMEINAVLGPGDYLRMHAAGPGSSALDHPSPASITTLPCHCEFSLCPSLPAQCPQALHYPR